MDDEAKNHIYLKSIIYGVFVGIGFAITYILGVATSSLTFNTISTKQNLEANVQYTLLAEVENLVNQVYLRDIPDAKILEYAVIRGFLSTLNDPATFFIDPPVASSESQALAGTYGGIGVQVKRLESGEFALYPFSDGPADLSGVRADDILLTVNDIAIDTTISIDVVDQLLRGEVADNNGVQITVQSLDGTTTDAFILFDVVNIPSVISRITSDDALIGYLQITRFTSRTPDELKAQTRELLDDNVTGLIIDLRDNGGGLLKESIEVADLFLTDEVIVIEQSRNENEIILAKSESSDILNVPIVILVNNRTASASEIVAGALKDNGRAILIGQQTFGKGTVQQIFPLNDGSSVHITSAEWFTPNETSINSNGLTPDIEMIPDENNRDVEFSEAIRYLQSILNKQSK